MRRQDEAVRSPGLRSQVVLHRLQGAFVLASSVVSCVSTIQSIHQFYSYLYLFVAARLHRLLDLLLVVLLLSVWPRALPLLLLFSLLLVLTHGAISLLRS